MTKTARDLHLTQPGISQIIAEIEKHLHVTLFDRIGRSLYLTYAGEFLHTQLTRINRLQHETLLKMESIAQLRDEKLRLGASMTLGNYLIPTWMEEFTKHHSGIEVHLTVDNTSRIEKALLGNHLDAAVVEGPVYSKLLRTQSLFSDPLALVVSPQHPWAQRKSVPIEEIDGTSLIMREEGSGTRDVIEGELKHRHITYTISHVINNIEGIKQAISANLGISILPHIAVQKEVSRGDLTIIEIDSVQLHRYFSLVFHQDKYMNQVITLWVNFLERKIHP